MSVVDWADMMPQTFTVERYTGRNVHGEKSYDTGHPHVYPCRIADAEQQVVGSDGRAVLSRQVIYAGTADPIGIEDRITLSTDDAVSTGETALHPQILAVRRLPDSDGPHHSEIRL